ncbi:MAG: hypothetical protein ACSHYA_06595 [Opitutaceae bacterium]
MNDTTTTPDQQPETFEGEQVLCLPGHLFFVEVVELPPALEASEIADFAELTVESLAPFPIEYLNWGFWYSSDATSLLIYATHRDRLKVKGFDKLNDYAWALPDFGTLSGAHFPEATEVTLISDDNVTLLEFDSGSETPTYVAALPLKSEDASETIESLRKESENNDDYPRKLSLRLTETKLNEQDIPTFKYTEVGTNNGESYGNWSKLTPSEKTLWQSDIRSGEYKTTERNARRTGRIITKVTAWAALFAFLLVGMEVLLLAGNAWLKTQKAQIISQQPTVAKIEDRQTLMNKLEQVALNELRPIAILEALNATRPERIFFKSTETEGENRITVDGEASTVNDLNNYITSLNRSGAFKVIDRKSQTKGGKTIFEATLDYTHTETPASETSTADAQKESPAPTEQGSEAPKRERSAAPNADLESKEVEKEV